LIEMQKRNAVAIDVQLWLVQPALLQRQLWLAQQGWLRNAAGRAMLLAAQRGWPRNALNASPQRPIRQ
jgi:hypothetical protein